MPGQHCLGAHEKHRPTSTREESRRSSQEDPVSVRQVWMNNLAPQDRKLVLEHHDLEILRAFSPETEQAQSEDSSDQQVQHRDDHGRCFARPSRT
jgi:hypothetical protein